MDFKLLAIFIILNIANVIIQTVKSIATVKCGKTIAAIINAVAYGLYTFVVIYMTIDGLNIWTKAGIIAAANFGGVFVVKLIEEKMRKDKLWKVEATVYEAYTESLHNDLNILNIPHNYIPNIGKYTIFNIYCETQFESTVAKRALDANKAKYFVSESKSLT